MLDIQGRWQKNTVINMRRIFVYCWPMRRASDLGSALASLHFHCCYFQSCTPFEVLSDASHIHQLKGKYSNECSKCYGDRDGPSVLNYMVIFSEEIDAVGDSSYDGQVKSLPGHLHTYLCKLRHWSIATRKDFQLLRIASRFVFWSSWKLKANTRRRIKRSTSSIPGQ